MKFFFFESPAERHLRKSRDYLADAKRKRVEHEAAAEHHKALTTLYAERIGRIESEISQVLQARAGSHLSVLAASSNSMLAASDPAPVDTICAACA